MKKLFLLLTAMLLCGGMWALDNVPYVDADGTTKSANNVTEITASSTLDAGWYVVSGEDVRTARLVCNGDVHLILADGAKLTATGADRESGIQVTGDNNSLTIYGQQNQIGQLIANGGRFGAGIGGGQNETGSNITINGGIITANGGTYGAGIGGGQNETGSNITINGGIITANGGPVGAGIGGGISALGSNIIINGGTVTATGGSITGAGIGGGNDNNSSFDIFVNASLVLIADENNPPTTHIAHSSAQDVSSKLFYRQYVIVRQPVKNITITLDKQDGTGDVDQVIVDENAAMPTISSLPTLDNYAFGGYYGAPNGQGTKYYNADGTSAHIFDKTEATTLYALWSIPHVDYVDADGVPHTADAVAEVTNTSTNLNAGWHVVRDADVKTGTLICDGDVHLILADGAKLTATCVDNNQAGIQVSDEGTSLTIYGQSAQTGELIANGGKYGAGIGGEKKYRDGSNITINGGRVKATGGHDGAGIGGGFSASGSNIIINGGDVTATGGNNATGIGGGYSPKSSSSNIVVDASLALIADENNPPTNHIANKSGQDVAQDLAGKRYAIVRQPVKSITITLDKQEGTGGVDKVVVDESADMPTISSLPTLDNYAFGGYYSAPKGHGTKYYNPDGTSAHIFDKTEAITLYALWSIPHVDYVDADGVSHTADAVAEVTNTTTILNAGWHAVVGEDVGTAGLVCNGEVHLILVDGAKLRASGAREQAGIQVSGDGNSLTIYGQSAQTGELIANGGEKGAGIGGEKEFSVGSNITINSGIVTANGGYDAAGIGGGLHGNGMNITINGGKVTANGSGDGAGIGGGAFGLGNNIIINGGEVTAATGYSASAIGGIDANHSSNIYVSDLLILKAGNSENPTEIIAHTSTQDVAQDLARKRYATIESASVTIATHYAADKGANYSTYYNGMVSYEVMTEGVTLYTASMETVGGETSLSLLKIEGYILPAGTAVVVRSENEEKVRLAPYIGSTEGIDVSGNVLHGVDVETATTELPGTLYVLSAQQQSGEGVATTAFYRYTGETMAPHKAFLQLAPGAPAPTRIVWGNRPVPTEIENVSGNENANENANANKVLRDGALYIIKGARTYNAQGVLVE